MAEIARTADGTLSFVPTHPEDPKAVVRELAMLLTDGRLNSKARQVLEQAYVRVKDLMDKEHALKAALKLLVLTAEFHSTKCVWDFVCYWRSMHLICAHVYILRVLFIV